MLAKITGAVAKKTLITVSTGILEGGSYLLDKGAELTDDGKRYIRDITKDDKESQEAISIKVVTSILDGASFILDEGSKLADEGKEFIEELGKDTKDTTAREKRAESRNSGIFGLFKKSEDDSVEKKS